MRVIRGLGVVLAIVLLLAGVAVASLYTAFGRQIVRDEMSSWLTTRLARPVRIEGEVTLLLGRSLQISASDVHIANVAWGSRTDMLEASRVMVDVDAPSLLKRSPTLIVNEMRVDGLDLLLERNADGDDNWRFDTRPSQSESSWMAALPFVVERVALPGAHVVFIGPRLDRPLDLWFADINQQRRSDDMLDISANGSANGTNLSVTGQIGPFANLIAAKAFSTSIDARVGQITLAINARIDDLSRPVESQVDAEVNGPDAAYVASTLGVRDLGDGPFKLTLAVSPSADGQGVRGSIVGRIGEFDISGDGELVDPMNMGKLTLRTEISGPDVSLLAGLIGFDLLPPERFRLAATIHRTVALLQIDQVDLELPDSALSVRGSIANIDRVEGLDLTVHIKGASIEKFRELLHVPGIATGPFDIAAIMRPNGSGADILQLDATTLLAKVSASGPLGAYPGYVGTRLNFSVSGANFAPFGRQFGLMAPPRSAYSAHGQFEWTPMGAVLHAASLKIGGDQLTLDGTIGKAPAFDGAVRFALQGKSLASVADFYGWKGLPSQAYKATGQIQRQSGRIRLSGVDVAAAGAHLQLGGTLAGSPKQPTTLRFTFDGNDLRPFQGMADVTLPAGTFRIQGAINYGAGRAQLQDVAFAAAGSKGVVSTDIGLPLGASVSSQPNLFDVSASGPNLRLLVPDAPESAVVNQQFALRAKGSWSRDGWSFETLRFDAPGGFINVQGMLDRAPDYSATEMSVQGRTADLGATGRMFGVSLPKQPLDFTATISGTPDTFRMQQLTGHFGESDFAGSVALDLKAKPDLNIRLRSNFLDLTPLSDTVVNGTTPPTPYPVDSRAIPNIALPANLLDEVDAQVAVQSAKTRFLGEIYDGMQLRGTLLQGKLTLDPLAFGSANGNLKIQLAIGPDLSTPNVRLVVTGDHVRLGIIPGINRTAAASLYKVQINVGATGLNLRDLAATLNGKIRFVGKGGRVPNSRISTALSSDFLSELMRTLNPLSKRQPYTEVECQAYLFDATNGILRTDPAIVVRTAGVDIISNGQANLRDETIDFNFKTAARGGLGISAGELLNNYVKVTGTFSKPHLTVDATGTLVNGGAAFATGGLSILATTLWDRVSRQKDPCASAEAEADRRSATQQSWW